LSRKILTEKFEQKTEGGEAVCFLDISLAGKKAEAAW